MREYIDIRGPHPIYFRGNYYVRLTGCNRDITIGDARLWIMTHGTAEDYMSISNNLNPVDEYLSDLCHAKLTQLRDIFGTGYVNHVDRRQGKNG